MAVSLAIETPLQGDVRALVAELNATMIPLTPPEFQFQMTVEQMADPAVTLVVARNEAGEAVGMGAIKDCGDGSAEVKRMFTRPAVRGERVGKAVLAKLEELAREKNLTSLVLETGEAEGFEPAYRIYERSGFTRCGRILDYPDAGHNRFYEKKLVP
ncbi:GNAT family N-acetyltransferase [Tianweitania sp.]|uniref:GNAT family N-acetyltransferase n=1 Tax=Tianweitania sp. TaxID=2021634 RepID=UPI00289FD7C0|nr:GNAT family N-acetyltransferase [Tianweitania sp.]